MGHDEAPGEIVSFFERGAGPPLLLIHGLMVSGQMFEPVVDPFASRHRVIVPDLRGHGQSRRLGPPYTVKQLAFDLVRLLDGMGVRSAAVLGYSQGGAIAQQLALDYPQRCNRLVLACTYAFNSATLRERVEGYVVPPLLRLFGMRAFARLIVSQGAKDLSKAQADWLLDLIGGQDRQLMALAWRATMAFDSRRRLADIGCPTLVIAGSEDRAVPGHHARMLAGGIRGSRLVIIDGAGHALIWTHADEFVRSTSEFLNE